MNNLNISLHIDSLGRIQCEDYTSYPSLGNSVYSVVEVLLDDKDQIVRSSCHIFYTSMVNSMAESLKNCNTPMAVVLDGKYTYIKLIIKDEIETLPEIQWSNIAFNELPTGSMFGQSTILVYKNLQRCLEYYQLKSFEETVSSIGPVFCKKVSEVTTIRDFLLCAVYLIEMYIQQEEFDEAKKIINSIDCCGLNCGYTNVMQNTGCNCG